MDLKPGLLRALKRNGFERLSPLQRLAVRPCVEGRDVVVLAGSGTGKTTTFVVSLLQLIDSSVSTCQAVILTPNRELAEHTKLTVERLGIYLGVHCCLCTGGTDLLSEKENVPSDPHVFVGTFHGIMGVLKSAVIKTTKLKMLIFNQLWRKVSPDFAVQVDKIRQLLPEELQILLFSNLMRKRGRKSIKCILQNSLEIVVNNEKAISKLVCRPKIATRFGTFEEMGLKPDLLHGLSDCGYERPFTVQQCTIKPCVEGRDVITLSDFGTGKTTAFVISLLQRIDLSLPSCQALISARNPEEAEYIETVIKNIGCHLGVRCCTCVGWTGIRTSHDNLLADPHVVVGTLGPLISMVERAVIPAESIKMLILCDLINGVAEQVFSIYRYLPDDVQVLLFCSSIPKQEIKMGETIMRGPLFFSLGNEGSTLDFADGPEITANYDEVVGSFEQMNLKPELIFGIYNAGYEHPSAIQQLAIKPCIEGRDVIALSEFGTGRTTTCAISVLQRIDLCSFTCQALILAPTRELAEYTCKVIKYVGKLSGVRCCSCVGGTNVTSNVRILQTGAQVVVGSLGRVIDMMKKGFLVTADIKVFAFIGAVDLLPEQMDVIRHYLPSVIQVLLFCDPVSKCAVTKVRTIMNDPVIVAPEKEPITLNVVNKRSVNTTDENFEMMNLKPNLLLGIRRCAYERPRVIQQSTIKPCLEGRDVIALSEFSTGKAGAFIISLLQRIDLSSPTCQAVILTSTVESAMKVEMVIKHMGFLLGVRCFACINHDAVSIYKRDVNVCPHVIVGTANSVSVLLKTGVIRTVNVMLFILYEILGSQIDTVHVIRQRLPDTVQTILFSITIEKRVLDFAKREMKDPLKIISREKLSYRPPKQFYIQVDKEEHKFVMLARLRDVLISNQVVIFVNTVEKARRVRKKLVKNKFQVFLQSSHRDPIERNFVVNQHRTGDLKMIISTDLLFLNILTEVSLVVNYDLPNNPEDYVHRMERFGQLKTVVTLITESDTETLKKLESFYSLNIVELRTEFIGHCNNGI
ncbi:unnamed protein product [Calicophoron daubneyi]